MRQLKPLLTGVVLEACIVGCITTAGWLQIPLRGTAGAGRGFSVAKSVPPAATQKLHWNVSAAGTHSEVRIWS